MLEVPEGAVETGCVSARGIDCRGYRAEGAVELAAFYIDKTEVTVRAYRECVRAGACTSPLSAPGGCDDAALRNWDHPDRAEHPVNCVDAFQAQQYCDYHGERLPTEHEWQKAARGTDVRIYPWGDRGPDCDLAILGSETGAIGGCGKGHTWPVGSRPRGASPYGVLDLIGNVSEIVIDSDRPVRFGPEPLAHTYTTARGGSYDTPPSWDRELYVWGPGRHTDVSPAIGFRCAMTVPSIRTAD